MFSKSDECGNCDLTIIEDVNTNDASLDAVNYSSPVYDSSSKSQRVSINNQHHNRREINELTDRNTEDDILCGTNVTMNMKENQRG